MTCKNCKHRNNSECLILNESLLLMVRTDNEQRVLDKKILLKDKTQDIFSCNQFKQR